MRLPCPIISQQQGYGPGAVSCSSLGYLNLLSNLFAAGHVCVCFKRLITLCTYLGMYIYLRVSCRLSKIYIYANMYAAQTFLLGYTVVAISLIDVKSIVLSKMHWYCSV